MPQIGAFVRGSSRPSRTQYTPKPTDQLKTVADWLAYSQTPVESRFTAKQVPGQGFGSLPGRDFQDFRGGRLSQSDIGRVQWLEQQEAEGKLQSSVDEAKAANLKRYEEILAGFGTRETKALESLEGLGDEERAAIERAYSRSGAAQLSGAVKQGLIGTTVPAALTRQNTTAMTNALGLVNERLRRQRIGLETGLSGEKLAFQERREDVSPDIQSYLNLSKQFGAAGT